MNEQVKGLIRHVLTFAGGIVVAKGWTGELELEQLVGAVMTIIGSVWSFTSKK